MASQVTMTEKKTEKKPRGEKKKQQQQQQQQQASVSVGEVAVIAAFPNALTEEEEALLKKYTKLRKKKKSLMSLKKQSSSSQTNQSGSRRTSSDQQVVDTAKATEQAKKLFQSGAISAIKYKSSGFKRSRQSTKLKDPEKGPVATSLPFQRRNPTSEGQVESGNNGEPLYESFVSPGHERPQDEEQDGRGMPSGHHPIGDQRHRECDREVEWERDHDPGRERDRESDRDRDRERDCSRDMGHCSQDKDHGSQDGDHRDRDPRSQDGDLQGRVGDDQDGDRPIQDGDHPIQNGDHPIRPIQDGDHPIQNGDHPFHPIQDEDHPIHPIQDEVHPIHPMQDRDHPIHPIRDHSRDRDHPIRDSSRDRDHPIRDRSRDRDHPIQDRSQDRDHPIQDRDHPIRDRSRDRDHRGRDRDHHSRDRDYRDRYHRSQVTDHYGYCSRDRDHCSRDPDNLIRDRDHRIRDRDHRFRDRDHRRDHRFRDRDHYHYNRGRERVRDGERGRSDSHPDRRGARKGNTVYVYGGLAEDSLRSVFSPHGIIIDLRVDNVRNCAFVTFEKMESADQAVDKLNGSTVDDVNIKQSVLMDPSTAESKGPSFRDPEEEEEFYDCQETLEVLNKERTEGGEERKREEDDAGRSLEGGLECGPHTQTGQGVGGQSECDGTGDQSMCNGGRVDQSTFDGTGEAEGTVAGATEEELQWDDEVGGRMDPGAAAKAEKSEAPPEFDDDRLWEVEENLTEEERESRRWESLALKEKGNGQFKATEYWEAERSYTKALGACPVCFGGDRAVLFSNRAAARLHLNLKDQAIADCSRAVELNPDYVRAILRRADLYEKTDKLDEALGDYKTVLEKEPGQSAAREACMRLPQQIHERDEKMKEEMLGKLKDLGDMILRPFGLSTSSFQVNQDTDTGSYSVNLVQNSKGNNSNR